MKLTFWQRCAVAMVGGVAVLGTASTASAISAETTGVRVYGGSNGDWSVQDTRCDAKSVYGRFTVEGVSGFQRRDNMSGCATEEEGNIGGAIMSVQACQDVTAGRDNCSGWNEWNEW